MNKYNIQIISKFYPHKEFKYTPKNIPEINEYYELRAVYNLYQDYKEEKHVDYLTKLEYERVNYCLGEEGYNKHDFEFKRGDNLGYTITCKKCGLVRNYYNGGRGLCF